MYRRQEASGIPHLLVAPKSGPRLPPPPPRQPHRTAEEGGVEDDDDEPIDRSIYTNGHGDARGYYYDGAYTAAPDPDPAPDLATHIEEDGGDAPELVAAAYFACLRDQFARLRTHLHTPPPPSHHLLRPDDDENENENNETQQQPPAHVVDPFGPSSRTFSVWTTRLRTTDPRPAQLARMDKHSVFRLLRVLLSGGGGGGSGKQAFLRSGAVVTERTSRWVWALLARLPDRGELDHVETAHVRELGKRAALLMHGLRQMARLQEEVALGGGGGGQGVEGFWGGDGDDDDDDDDDDYPPAETTTKRTTGPHENNNNNNNHEPPADGASAAEDTRGDIPNAQQDDEREDGEIDNSSSEEGSAPMDMDHEEEDVDAARARLLARLDAVPSSPPSSPPGQKEGEREREQEKTETFDPVRARMNMRATLTMILTVAGEFYGQRDLLEFRDPFRGL